MKITIILFVFLGIVFSAMAQKTMPVNDEPQLAKEDYLMKSKANKNGALVCLIGGGTLFLIGDVIALSDLHTDLDNLFTDNQSSNHDAIIGVLVITGGLAMLGSIPLFRAAHRNKRKALSMSFKNEPALQIQRSTVFYNAVPSLSLRLRL
ncbi:MAG: hypothetical protein ABIS01_03905 [Ferruginibacter sp.]